MFVDAPLSMEWRAFAYHSGLPYVFSMPGWYRLLYRSMLLEKPPSTRSLLLTVDVYLIMFVVYNGEFQTTDEVV